MDDFIEDMDFPDGTVISRRGRKIVTSSALASYREEATPVRRIPKSRRRLEITRLIGISGDDRLSCREAEYVKQRVNALRGLTYDGKPKRRRRADPVLVQIRKMQQLIEEDRRSNGANGRRAGLG